MAPNKSGDATKRTGKAQNDGSKRNKGESAGGKKLVHQHLRRVETSPSLASPHQHLA
jgi:hypothetical protein